MKENIRKFGTLYKTQRYFFGNEFSDFIQENKIYRRIEIITFLSFRQELEKIFEQERI
jgi:hypothetical protein